MRPDFTLSAYYLLIEALNSRGIIFCRLDDFLLNKPSKGIILRHDVDAKPENSLAFARIQYGEGIQGSYYFNARPTAREERIIREIHNLGHETGYHYNTMESCKGNAEKAWDEFRINLDSLRKIVPVRTITMHGSPFSPFDNRALWNKYDYHSLGIAGEPYLDLNFSEVAYLTDTGRRWDGADVSVRDKVNNNFDLRFRTTTDIVKGAGRLPARVLFTFHPQRWSNKPLQWAAEYCCQNIKNSIKYYLVRYDFR